MAGHSSVLLCGPLPACGSLSCLQLGWVSLTAYGPEYGWAHSLLVEARPTERKDTLSVL